MGGCAGKTKSKRTNPYEQETRTKDDSVQSKSSSAKNVPSSNNSTVKNDQYKDENGIDSDIQTTIKESNGVNNAIGQIFSNRVISVSDAELEYELANLIYGHPENDYAENPLVATTFKSTEV